MQMLILVRETATEKAVQGCLFLNDTFICYTLENASKAIPTGGYNIENSKSPKFKRELPLLFSKAVPASRGIRIHVGSDAVKDSSGCVLVGMGRKGDKLTESQLAETMVTMLCRNVKKLIIIDATP
ncbi:MAG: hypothetical protein J6T54_06395 [Fibrobacter sp.]|nr:hypothetical protein [Fibrobacter sp.]